MNDKLEDVFLIPTIAFAPHQAGADLISSHLAD